MTMEQLDNNEIFDDFKPAEEQQLMLVMQSAM